MIIDNMKKSIILSLVFMLIACFSSLAAIKVNGIVVDSLSLEPEPMVTIRIMQQGNDTPVALGTTDDNGVFSIELKGKGQYTLMITAIGRNPLTRDFTVASTKSDINLGTLKLAESAEALEDVVVAVQRPVVKMEGDKIAYSVKDDPDSKTNTVLEMLRKVPMVTVDGEDNIQVNGSSSFQVYMNGKPSAMLSGNPKETLKAIPASIVKNIEVLTNPGAKYDAEGVGGILNIITDQQEGMTGYTGSISAQFGNRMNGGDAYVMVQKDKLTLSANLHEGYMKTPKVEATMSRDQLTNNQHIDNEITLTGGANTLFSTVDATYAFDDKNTMSATINVMDIRNKSDMDFTTDITLGGKPLTSYSQVNNNKTTMTSVNASVDYSHIFGDNPQHNITMAYRVSTQPRTNDSKTEYSIAEMPAYNQTDKNNMLENTVQLDYAKPIDEHNTVELGGKYVWRNSTSRSDLLDYEHKSSIGALYGVYGFSYDKYSIKGGIRYEHTSLDVAYKKGNGDDFSLDYDNFVPNLTLSYSPTPTQNVSLGYNMRISRPGISVLNPYRNTQDINNVSYGNPELEIEKVNNIQATYNYYSLKLMLNATLRYSYQDNGIEQYSYYEDNVLYSTYDNIGRRQNTSLSLFASWAVTPKTRLTINSTTSYVDLSAGALGYKNSGWQETFMINLQQNLPWDMKLSAMYMGNTPSATLQGETSGINMHMLGLTKTCLNDRLTFSVNTINIFNSEMKMDTTTEGKDFVSKNSNSVKMASVIGSVTYRFGDLKMKKQERTELDSDLIEATDSNDFSKVFN